jgi:ubiquinone/menaquinone biosynthesis C-methylase UbiE
MGQTLRTWWVKIMLWGFTLLYHGFAWVYDFAAWIVSAGKWNDWIRSAGELALEGPVLDMGCGKGILLQFAAQKGIPAVGIDESPQMLRYARRLLSSGDARLVRGVGQSLPLKTGCFRHLTATFPAPYIFELSTLTEIRRVLEPGGNVIILLTAEVTGSSLHERIIRFFSGLFGFGYISETVQDSIQKPFREAGFMAHMEWIPGVNARLLVIIGHPV